MPTSDSSRRISTYLVIVFAISTVCYWLIISGGGLTTSAQLYILPLMWSPAIAALVTTYVYQRNLRGLGWGLGKPKYYLIAYLLPIGYAGIVYVLVWAFGLGALDTTRADGPLGRFLISSLSVRILGSMLLAVGEEIGWRGLLVPQLARTQSFTRIALISGVIWGIWHVPLIIGGGYSSGAPTWYAVTCFMVLVIGMSFAFTWLRLASGSIWPSTLMHATHNTFIQAVLDKLTLDTGNTAYFTTEFGLGLAIMGVLAAVIFTRLARSLHATRTIPAAETLPGNP